MTTFQFRTALALLLLPVLALALFAFTPKGEGYKVGDKARDFKLKNIDGSEVSLSGMEDAKGYIVVFTCNHCPYAKMYEERIIDLHKKYAAKGFPVVAVNPNDAEAYPEDSFEGMKKRAEEKSFPFVYLHDESQEIAKAFGAKKTPHVYLLKKEGNDRVVSYIGAIDNDPKGENIKTRYLENAVDALLEDKKINETETKAVGCSIKWKK